MRRAKPPKKNKFVDDEAEHSGEELGDEDIDFGEEEYDLQDPFIDDANCSLPPLVIEPIITEMDEVSIVPYVPPVVPPLKPPPPVKPPPPKGKGAPPAKPPAKKPASDWIRPKTNRDKRMCQIVQQALIPAVAVGYLQHVLVTVIPDPQEKLEEAWQHVQERREILTLLAKSLDGLFGFIIALETHGAAADKQKKKRKNPNAEDAAHQAEQRGEEPAAPAKKDTLAGKPHFHVLLYYPRLGREVYNLSHYKHLVMTRLMKSDVNEIKLPHEESDYLDTVHIHEMIFPVLFKGLDANICERCQLDAQQHKNQWIIRDNASGHYEFLARVCQASGKAFGERIHYNKWSRTQVGESEIVSFAEYYGSDKLTQ